MTIEYLCDNLSFADTVARWTYDEFIKGVRDDITYEKMLHLFKNCHNAELPIRLVAIENGKCIGTVSIVENDLKCRDYTPWLAALYVDADYRNRKVGEALVERVKDIIKELGYREVFLRTEHASGYYEKLGWRFVESCEDNFNLKPYVWRWVMM